MQEYGDAKLVNSNNIIENNEEEVVGALVENDDSNIEDTIETKAKVVESDEYYDKSRLERDTMFSQMIESYQKILENNQIATDQKGIAQTEIKRINDLKNAIMICENLIKTKGFEDVIIFINDKSISVIIKKDKLEAQEIAQIQNIVIRELNSDVENVHISTK